MEKVLQKDPKIARADAFEKSRKKANDRYKQEMIKVIKQTAEMKAQETEIIFFEKNHPPNGIGAVNEVIDRHIPQEVDFLKLYLVPEHH